MGKRLSGVSTNLCKMYSPIEVIPFYISHGLLFPTYSNLPKRKWNCNWSCWNNSWFKSQVGITGRQAFKRVALLKQTFVFFHHWFLQICPKEWKLYNLIPTSSGCEWSSGCSSLEVEKRMLLLCAVLGVTGIHATDELWMWSIQVLYLEQAINVLTWPAPEEERTV